MKIRQKTASNNLYCECDHPYERHTPGGGSCRCNDSYGSPCECASYVELLGFDSEYDEEEYDA